MKVQSLQVYPVKATGPVALPAAAVEPHGLRHDRRWAVVDLEGRRLNATRHAALLQVTATPDDSGIELSRPGVPTTYVPSPVGGPRVDVDISRFPSAVDAGEAAARFFSAVLRQDVRLVWQDDPARRPVSDAHGGLGGEPLSLADAGPLLVTSTASLEQLNEWARADETPETVVMQRFRPNVVVEGAEGPFVEDDWGTVRIGEVEFRFAEHCDRCSVTLIDPATLARGKEPVRTLARHRRWDGSTWFGIRVVPLGVGTISVGDAVTAR